MKKNQTYFVAQHEGNNLFASYNRDTETVEWVASESEADWDESEAVVEGYINRFGLPGAVKPKPGTGLNHPPKPPISAM
jgi:hypothetical protein